MREGWIRSVGGGMLFFMAVSALGCATATAPPMPAKAVSDVKSVAGNWSGTGHTPVGTNPLNWTIKEDGTVEVLVATPTGPVTGVGKVSVKENADPGFRRDVVTALDRLFPPGIWEHDKVDDNGAAHLKAALLGPSEMVPIQDGRLQLGTWQGIALVECDGPREREILVDVR